MKCFHCKEELGDGDEYDLLKSHMYFCHSKAGRAYSKSFDDSDGHSDYCTCEKCV